MTKLPSCSGSPKSPPHDAGRHHAAQVRVELVAVHAAQHDPPAIHGQDAVHDRDRAEAGPQRDRLGVGGDRDRVQPRDLGRPRLDRPGVVGGAVGRSASPSSGTLTRAPAGPSTRSRPRPSGP
jgi:hypothetical protein